MHAIITNEAKADIVVSQLERAIEELESIDQVLSHYTKVLEVSTVAL